MWLKRYHAAGWYYQVVFTINNSKLVQTMKSLIVVLSVLVFASLAYAQPRPPDLAMLRANAHHVLAYSANGSASGSTNSGGGGYISSGVTYDTGQFQALNSATIVTTVIVQPQGLNPSNSNLQWMFETATNHMQLGVEFVVIYYENMAPSIGVYDWSLVPSAWVWTSPLSKFVNNVKNTRLPDGHLEASIRYANSTIRTGTGWENKVLMWDYKTLGWDVEYIHNYTGTQEDCSNVGCAFWAGTLETFPTGSPTPMIRPLGFLGMHLEYDGAESNLSSNITKWAGLDPAWNLLDFVPNTSFVVGNFSQ